MLYFVGAALIAGAVVHYPIDPPVFGAGVVIVAVVTWFGMNAIADSMESTGHDHGIPVTPADESPAEHESGSRGH